MDMDKAAKKPVPSHDDHCVDVVFSAQMARDTVLPWQTQNVVAIISMMPRRVILFGHASGLRCPTVICLFLPYPCRLSTANPASRKPRRGQNQPADSGGWLRPLSCVGLPSPTESAAHTRGFLRGKKPSRNHGIGATFQCCKVSRASPKHRETADRGRVNPSGLSTRTPSSAAQRFKRWKSRLSGSMSDSGQWKGLECREMQTGLTGPLAAP